MTLNDIIVSTLAQLDRGHDSQTIETWRGKLTGFANEAMLDLATMLQLRRTDTVTLANGILDTLTLPETCVKVLSVLKGGATLPVYPGPTSTQLRVTAPDGTVDVHYRYLPKDMENPTDVPDLPSFCHSLITTYVVARERAAQDPSMQRGASIYFELYNAGKRSLREAIGLGVGGRTQQIINRW